MLTNIVKKIGVIQHSWSCEISPIFLRYWRRNNFSSYLTSCCIVCWVSQNSVRFFFFLWYCSLNIGPRAWQVSIPLFNYILSLLKLLFGDSRLPKSPKLTWKVFCSPNWPWICSLSDSASWGATMADTIRLRWCYHHLTSELDFKEVTKIHKNVVSFPKTSVTSSYLHPFFSELTGF